MRCMPSSYPSASTLFHQAQSSFVKMLLLSAVALLAGVSLTQGAPSAINTLVERTAQGTGTDNGYFYSFWADYSNVNYNNGPGGSYNVSWSTGGNFVAGKGWNPGSPRYILQSSLNTTSQLHHALCSCATQKSHLITLILRKPISP